MDGGGKGRGEEFGSFWDSIHYLWGSAFGDGRGKGEGEGLGRGVLPRPSNPEPV